MIETRVLTVSPQTPEPSHIEEAASIIKAGGLVAFPTETVYGLGADALRAEAVEKVFEAKGRPADNPLIIHIAHEDHLFDLIEEMPAKGAKLAKAFWPGPLTLVVKRTFLVPDIVAAHLDTVAVRMPKHPVALALIRAVGSGIVGPSANLSTRPSPTTAQHVLHDLRGKVNLILDAGPTTIGVESTVVDVTLDPPLILRRGGLPVETIEKVIGRITVSNEAELLQRSPGTRHRHYAPVARVVLVNEGDQRVYTEAMQTFRQEGKKVGAIVHSPKLSDLERSEYIRAVPNSHEFIARHLFAFLREMDELGVDIVVVEGVPEYGLGAAIMDRLRRAAEPPATNSSSPTKR
jgi:L-threonylcarbamoyladenylate synthase